jgi:hypothetical protein
MNALTSRVLSATNDTHFGTVGEAPDIDGVVHGQLRYIADGIDTVGTNTTAMLVILGTDTYTETASFGSIAAAVRNDDLAALADTDNEIAPLQVDSEGALYTEAAQQVDYVFDAGAKVTVKRFNVVATADGDTIISAPTGTKKIRVRSIAVVAMSATESEIYFETGTTGTDTLGNVTNGFLIALDADGNNIAGINWGFNPDGWLETADADETLDIKMSSNQPMHVMGTYIEVA